MNSTVKTVLFWAVIVVSAFLLWQVVKTGGNATKEKEIGFSEFLSDVDQGNVHDVMFIGQEVKGKFKNDAPFHTIVPANYPDMYKKLTDKGVPYGFKDISNGTWPSWILNLAPLVSAGRALVLHDPADADGRQQGAVVWQEPGSAALHAAEEDHVQRRSRRG